MSPTKAAKTRVNLGDLYALGDHRLLCGDAGDMVKVSKVIGGEPVHLILTDPPYGVAYVESKAGFGTVSVPDVIKGDQLQSQADYRGFTRRWLAAVTPYLAKKNACYIFNSDKMLFALREGMQDEKLKFAQLLIWIKQQPVLGRLDYQPQHELIAYGWLGTHEFQKAKDKSIIFYPRPNRSKHHPTQKPVGLLRRLILNSTKLGETVYDPFLGSGSTLLAAEQTKRRCLAVELEPKHCQTVIDRYEALTGIKAVKAGGFR